MHLFHVLFSFEAYDCVSWSKTDLLKTFLFNPSLLVFSKIMYFIQFHQFLVNKFD